ncbi:hypothetical protein LCGC14_0411150 [marine sediment metagenome]|uniref:4Fe-4S ferredoxin-type domain-containing protein n=1 Tax=marine sediment metagenome TaxID=412755 RepID=A0A0F9TBU5_9ZZZZ
MIYPFKCEGCGLTVDFVCPYAELKGKDKTCINCSAKLVRDWHAGMPRVYKDSYTKPIHSDSLAIHPEQVEEHRRLYPKIPLDEKCRPVFENYPDHDEYLEQTGHVKQSGRRKRKTVTLASK